VDLIDRPAEKPWGAGEPSAAVVSAAVSNAVFDATGARLRPPKNGEADIGTKPQASIRIGRLQRLTAPQRASSLLQLTVGPSSTEFPQKPTFGG
jgi:hypothetical protein